MEKRKIGSLVVTAVGLGCNNFGGRLDEDETKKVVRAALDAGIDFFDTEDIYGNHGLSEEYLGRALGTKRRDIFIATKFGMPMDDKRRGARPEYVRQAAEDSLRRLGTGHIDLYQIHQPDPSVPIAETLGALNDLVRAGKVREIGCSNFSVAEIRDADSAASTLHTARFVSVQNEYSLLHREPEGGVLAECERVGAAFLPFFPLAGGLLTGKYHRGQAAPAGTRLASGPRASQLTDVALQRVEALRAFAHTRGHSLLDLAFSWLLSHREVASVIAGATKPEQITANVAAVGWRMTDAERNEIDVLVKIRH